MNLLFAGRAGDNLHRACGVVAPGPCPDLAHATAPSWKQGRMPRKEPFEGERLVIVASSVEHHFNDAVDIAVCGLECADIHTEAARNRGPNLFSIQLLSLDFAAFEYVGGQGLQYGFLAQVETKSLHVADQSALPVADGPKRFGEVLAI